MRSHDFPRYRVEALLDELERDLNVHSHKTSIGRSIRAPSRGLEMAPGRLLTDQLDDLCALLRTEARERLRGTTWTLRAWRRANVHGLVLGRAVHQAPVG